MATYIQGVTDYIPQIQPFQPDLNFFGNVLQTKQTKYDAAKKKVGDLYGSLLYAPLTGDDNIQRRDDFFKMINGDLRKISGMDLSLQQNQDAAMKIFDPFFQDQDIMYDMGWTKKLMNAEQKHEAMMNCFDPVKCGGQGWLQGGQELQFKREDFRKATNKERKNIAAPTYTPYYNWQKDAMKAAKDAGYKVSRDELTGDYIVKKTNGDLIVGGLYNVFKEAYGNDPRVEANYLTQAYVTRKLTAKNDASLYGSEDAAEREYMGVVINKGLAGLYKNLDVTNSTYNSIDIRIQELEKKSNTKSLTKEEQALLDEAYTDRESAQGTKEYLEKNINAIKANAENGDLNVLRSRSDNAQSQIHLQDDLKRLAKTLSIELNSDLEIKTNPFAEINKRLQADMTLEGYKSGLRKDEKLFEHDLNKEIEYIKLGKKVGAKGESNPEDFMIIDGVAGTNVDMGLADDISAGYELNHEEWKSINAKAQAGAGDFNQQAFVAAKSAGATDYLDKVYGKGKWENVNENDPEAYQKLVAGKTNTNIFNATMEHLKAKTLNIGWLEQLTLANKKTITDTKLAEQAANGTLRFNIGVNKKIADEMKGQIAINRLYRYVDELFYKTPSANKVGSYLNKDYGKGIAPAGFIKKYTEEHLNSSSAEAQKAYEFLYQDFHKRYNNERNKNASINTGYILGGTGNISSNTLVATGVDPSERAPTSTNMYTKDLLTQVVNDQGNAYVGIGPNTGSVYKDAINNADKNIILKNILADVVADINKSGDITNKDDKKNFYDIKVAALAGGQSGMGSAQIVLSEDYLDKRSGKGKMIPEALRAELSNYPINIFFDKSKIKTPMIELSKDSDFQRALKTNGSVSINTYEENASIGPIKATATTLNGRTTVKYDVTLKQRNLDGSWTPVSAEIPPTGLAESTATYNMIMAGLHDLEMKNLKIMKEEEKLNKQKQQQ